MSFLKTKIGASIILVVFVLTLTVFFVGPSEKTTAIVPFGGPILKATFCTCSFNILLTVGPPLPGNYIYQPGVSIPYAYGQVFRSGPWVLGNWIPGGMCSMWIGKACVPLPSAGTILEVGTSL